MDGIAYVCIDCGSKIEVSKRRARTFDGKRCPVCDGGRMVPSAKHGNAINALKPIDVTQIPTKHSRLVP